jgi:outer membrane protein OmpA-like peptidoglycan-associated protein
MTRVARGALAVAAIVAVGCPSAYQRTYDRKLSELETQARARDAEEAAAHAEARRYAAVVYFAPGSATVGEEGARELRWFAGKMQPYPQAVIEVQGFTDSTGSEATNQALAGERAAAVARYLASQGIDASRIVAQGFGSESPARPNETPQGRRSNRRVEVTVR